MRRNRVLPRIGAAGLIAVALCACEEPVEIPVRNEIVGTWTLVVKRCAFPTTEFTPASLGHSVTLDLTATGQATVLFDDSVSVVTPFVVSGGEGIFHEMTFGATTFFGFNDVQVVISNHNMLDLQWHNPEPGCLATLWRSVARVFPDDEDDDD